MRFFQERPRKVQQEQLKISKFSLSNIRFKRMPGAAAIGNFSVSPSKLNKKSRKKVIRWSLIIGNIVLLMGIGGFVLSNRSASQTVRASTLNSAIATARSLSNPLDQLSSSQIALTAAQLTQLPELSAIKNQAESDSLILSVVPNDSSSLAKPQLVATAQKSKQDIVHYTTVAGDTIDSLSTKFNVTANSIRWSNNIAGNNVTAGLKIVIPPVNGIVYTVKASDTPASLATRYQSDQSQIISYNDAEISGLTPGEQIIIPNGQVAAPVLTYGSYVATYGGNGYDYGYCTWYVANKVGVPTNWGNANTWAFYASLSGWTVSPLPKAGAIAQTGAGFQGHVAYVEAVSDDGTMIQYSDMNNYGDGGGWGKVGHSSWVSAGSFPHYIYH